MRKTGRKADGASGPRTSTPGSKAVKQENAEARPALRVARPELSHEQIARRAYEIYLQRGGEGGRDLDDWVEAERQLMARIA